MAFIPSARTRLSWSWPPRVPRGRRISGAVTAALLAVSGLAVTAAPAGAEAVELVADGGFEETVDDYVNPHWSISGSNAGFFTAGHTGSWSGGLDNYFPDEPVPALEQTVNFPDDSTVELAFERRFYGTAAAPLLVYIDGELIHLVNNDQPSAWRSEVVDVSAFADGTAHVLRFERVIPGPAGSQGGSNELVLIDDVSAVATPAVPTVVELTYKPGKRTFVGNVHAQAGCGADRTVLVKRVRRGADPTVARQVSGASGAFKARATVKPGLYYAVAKAQQRPHVMCLADRSLGIQVY